MTEAVVGYAAVIIGMCLCAVALGWWALDLSKPTRRRSSWEDPS